MQVRSGKGYNLDVSLFERLIEERQSGGASARQPAYFALEQQHRMRPEIAAPVRALMYPELRDGPGTAHRPAIDGLQPDSSAFLITHSWLEGHDAAEGVGVAESASKINPREAEMTVAVLRYLLQQGYRAADCVVLTPYLGQLRVLRRQMREGDVTEYVDVRDESDLVKEGLADVMVRLACV